MDINQYWPSDYLYNLYSEFIKTEPYKALPEYAIQRFQNHGFDIFMNLLVEILNEQPYDDTAYEAQIGLDQFIIQHVDEIWHEFDIYISKMVRDITNVLNRCGIQSGIIINIRYFDRLSYIIEFDYKTPANVPHLMNFVNYHAIHHNTDTDFIGNELQSNIQDITIQFKYPGEGGMMY